MPDPELMKKYVVTLSQRVRDGKTKGLTDTERRLATKLVEHQNAAQLLSEDISRTQVTIRRAQERLESLTRDHLQEISTSAGFAESLISLKFGDAIEKEEKKPKKSRRGQKEPPAPKPPQKKRRTRRKTK